MRDCENCAWCGRYGCKSWDCDFVPREEAVEAWKEKHRKTEPQAENLFTDKDGDVWEYRSTPHHGWYKIEPTKTQTEVVKDSQDLVKDLVKAFCEDGTWLERQGVYTLTLAEAKQRAVDIIESVMAKESE